MASEKDICNLALQRIGQFAELTSLQDNTEYSELASTAYAFVRDALLERHAWNFATARTKLPELDIDTGGWRKAYALPFDCLRVLSVEYATEHSLGISDAEWVIENYDNSRVLFTNCENAVVKYIKRVVPTGYYSPMFVDALAWNLAYELAGPIIKGDAGQVAVRRVYELAVASEAKAIQLDANQRRTKPYRYKTMLEQ